MRRWFAILLLALLPLQLSWAAVTVYCGHESGKQARHLGHHEHQHGGQAGVDPSGLSEAGDDEGTAPADRSVPPGLDLDCSHCHASCANLPTPVTGLVLLRLSVRPAWPAGTSLRTLAQSPPERPQWSHLA